MSFRSSDGNRRKKPCKYVYELPYQERNELCLSLDVNNKWKDLGGRFLKFDYRILNRFEMNSAYRSPTENLLNEWGSQNGTIEKLFEYLCKMRNYQAMRILSPFVDEKYHRYIKEEEDPSFSSSSQYSPSDVPRSSSRSERRDPTAPPATSQSSSQRRRTGSGSGDTPATLETLLMRASLDTCSLHIPYKELERATSNWNNSRFLGKGGFGVVFNGSWKNTFVAIKRLESRRRNDNEAEVQRQQSLRELKYLNNYKHDNILPLYGYSIDGETPCLVYQLMSNGSLEDRLQCKQNTKPLSWRQRVSIANGSARGLQFLHSMDVPLIHGDIKSANILLDSNFVPKIGDFGLAKEGPVRDITHVEITKVQGTRPYLPIEFLRGKQLSVKVDTYGFGVVLCEVATGLKAYDESRKPKFLREVCHEADENHLVNLKDQKADYEEDYFFLPLIKLGIHCTHEKASRRPLMADVLRELDLMIDLRRESDIVRRPSLPPASYTHLLPGYLYPSNPASRQPVLSTSPTPPSNTLGFRSTRCDLRKLSPPAAHAATIYTPNPANGPVPECVLPNENIPTPPPSIHLQSATPRSIDANETNYEPSTVSTRCSTDDGYDFDNRTEAEAPIPIVPELEN